MTGLPTIYDGHLVHVRHEPVRRVFRHRLYLWCVDLDDLPAGSSHTAAAFDAADHLGDPNRSIRENVDAWLAEHGIDLEGGRVTMLASPRVLGYTFNPLTVYWCHGPGGDLRCAIAEVHNTYGERHCYLVPANPTGVATVDKQFYVSPFFPVRGHYWMRLPEPGARLNITVSLWDHGRRAFTASLAGRGLPAERRVVRRLAVTAPLMPQRVSLLIRRHGIAMWLRRFPRAPRPPRKDRS